MNTPANRFRDLHRAIDALGNQASGLGLFPEANQLWSIAATIKKKGAPVMHAWSKDVERTECGLSIYDPIYLTTKPTSVTCPDCKETFG